MHNIQSVYKNINQLKCLPFLYVDEILQYSCDRVREFKWYNFSCLGLILYIVPVLQQYIIIPLWHRIFIMWCIIVFSTFHVECYIKTITLRFIENCIGNKYALSQAEKYYYI